MTIEKIVSEVHESVPFSIFADESADVSADEQLSISVRYITTNISNNSSIVLNVKFLGFVTVTDLTGEGIASSIESYCTSSGLDLRNLVGWG